MVARQSTSGQCRKPLRCSGGFIADSLVDGVGHPGLDGLVVTDDPILETLIPRLVTLTAQRHLPALYAFSTAVRQGGLMSYSADIFAMWRRAGSYVDRILKGERPGDLPIEQPTAVNLKINLKTAKALGLSVPASLIVAADEVIE